MLARRSTGTHFPIDFRKGTAHHIGYNNTDPYRESVSSPVLLHGKVRVNYRTAPLEPAGIQFLAWGYFGSTDPCMWRDLYPSPNEGSECGISERGTDCHLERSKWLWKIYGEFLQKHWGVLFNLPKMDTLDLTKAIYNTTKANRSSFAPLVQTLQLSHSITKIKGFLNQKTNEK